MVLYVLGFCVLILLFVAFIKGLKNDATLQMTPEKLFVYSWEFPTDSGLIVDLCVC